MHNGFAGVDVSKARLDVYLTEGTRGASFANDEAGIEALVEALLKANPKRIVLEATGDWSGRW